MNSGKIRWLLGAGCLGYIILFAGVEALWFGVLTLTYQSEQRQEES